MVNKFLIIGVFFLIFFFPCVLPNLFASSESISKFSVSDMSLYFEKSQKPIKNISIKNSEKSPIYLSATIKKITNNDFELPTLQDTKEIIITPKKLIISPNENSTFRVIYLPTMSKVESQYQIFLTPVDKDFTKKSNAEDFVINVVSDPLVINDNFKFYRNNNLITFKNLGNRSVYILHAKTCKKLNCKTVSDVRIPHASELKLNVNDDDSFEFIKKTGNEFEKIKIN